MTGYLADGATGGVAELTPATWLTAWQVDSVPTLAILAVAAAYLAGVWILRRRGVAWSTWRTIAFVGGGLGAAWVATASALAVYETTLLWTHMIQHMVLSMVVPIFLALGAPVTLALRTLPARPRRALLGVLHSRYARVVSHPLVAGALFVATPFAVYLTGWHEATLSWGLLHNLNHLHFVAVGCLWFWPMLGLDPVPGRVPYLFRLLAVLLTLPAHAFLGMALMSTDRLIAADWYVDRYTSRGWGPTPAQDQEIAGGILWGVGDVVGLLVAVVLVVQWFAESDREAAREDRRLDRLEAEKLRAAAP